MINGEITIGMKRSKIQNKTKNHIKNPFPIHLLHQKKKERLKNKKRKQVTALLTFLSISFDEYFSKGFRVLGLGFRVGGTVLGLGFRVGGEGLGFRV